MDSNNKVISLVLRIEGGAANEGLLDVYDAATTINGLARAINLSAHSFANNDEIRKKNQRAEKAKAFIHSSLKGCFEEKVDVFFDDSVIGRIGHSVIGNVFWDYVAWTWNAAAGIEYSPKTPYVKKIQDTNDLFIYEMSDALENPIKLIHRPMKPDSGVMVYINRPRVGDVLDLTEETYDYVSTREEETETEYILGNITRVNILSQFGRLFSDEEGRVVSFELANPDDSRVKGLSLKSMQNHNEGQSGKVHLKVSRVVSAQGVVKRYIIHDILEFNE